MITDVCAPSISRSIAASRNKGTVRTTPVVVNAPMSAPKAGKLASKNGVTEVGSTQQNAIAVR
jgi:hypothetical protein